MDLLERWAEKREARKAYMRTYMNKYYETHSEQILASQKPYKEQRRKPTAEKRSEYNRKYYETHRDECIRRVKENQEKKISP
jgi:hypothetical protein